MPAKSNDELRHSNERMTQMQLQSNERLAQLERESNEHLALLQRQQQNELEQKRQMLEDYRRVLDRNFSREERMEQMQHAEYIRLQNMRFILEQKFDDLERNERQRQEDLLQKRTALLNDFIQETLSASQPLNTALVGQKVRSLSQVLDPTTKSALVDFLYRMRLVQANNASDATAIVPLDLRGANLSYLDLSESNPGADHGECHS